MPYKHEKYKHFKNKADYDKYEAYVHMHNIPHKHHETVIIGNKLHHPRREKRRKRRR